MAKVNVRVVGAYVDGNAPGTQINVEEKSAKYLEKIGYAKIVKEAPKPAPKKKAAPRKKATTDK